MEGEARSERPTRLHNDQHGNVDDDGRLLALISSVNSKLDVALSELASMAGDIDDIKKNTNTFMAGTGAAAEPPRVATLLGSPDGSAGSDDDPDGGSPDDPDRPIADEPGSGWPASKRPKCA